ncbi:MAG: hypothetical protein JNJ88_19960 [Planctomycetes bacterium]|nr:hypothetical protein [Planctomycetota bacterium]
MSFESSIQDLLQSEQGRVRGQRAARSQRSREERLAARVAGVFQSVADFRCEECAQIENSTGELKIDLFCRKWAPKWIEVIGIAANEFNLRSIDDVALPKGKPVFEIARALWKQAEMGMSEESLAERLADVLRMTEPQRIDGGAQHLRDFFEYVALHILRVILNQPIDRDSIWRPYLAEIEEVATEANNGTLPERHGVVGADVGIVAPEPHIRSHAAPGRTRAVLTESKGDRLVGWKSVLGALNEKYTESARKSIGRLNKKNGGPIRRSGRRVEVSRESLLAWFRDLEGRSDPQPTTQHEALRNNAIVHEQVGIHVARRSSRPPGKR